VFYLGLFGVLAAGGYYYGSQPSVASFTLTQRVKAPSNVVFESEREPETYWKYARKGYK